jgi:small subunit ribosomal protein S11e
VSIRGRILTGTVRSTKMARTLIVRRDYLHFIKKYQRYEKRHTNVAGEDFRVWWGWRRDARASFSVGGLLFSFRLTRPPPSPPPAHISPAFRAREGDQVVIGQCRPLSKTVRFNVLRVIPAGSQGKKGFTGF